MSHEKAIKLEIPDELWEDSGPTSEFEEGPEANDPSARMFVTISIMGVLHYLEAYAVKDDPDMQTPAYEGFEDNFSGAYAVGQPDKRFDTVTIKGREYILVMTPSC